MTFIELVEKVSKETGMSKKIVKKILHATSSTINLRAKDLKGEVKWFGFGRFSFRMTRAGKAFGRPLTPRPTIKFTPYR